MSNSFVSCLNDNKHEQKYLPFPQRPLTAEVLKAVGKVVLAAIVFEAKRDAEVDQCWLLHLFSVLHWL